MKPPKIVPFPQNRDMERAINYNFEDIYSRAIHDTPDEKAAWAKLTTTAEQINFLAQKLGLV